MNATTSAQLAAVEALFQRTASPAIAKPATKARRCSDQEAAAWLERELHFGPMFADLLHTRARKRGFSIFRVLNAGAFLKARISGDGADSTWSLPHPINQ